MTLPNFQRKPEGWMQDPIQLAKHEQALKELQERTKPLPAAAIKDDARHLPEQERKLLELQEENKTLKAKVAELFSDNEELTELLRIAAAYKKFKLPVRKTKGIFDFIDANKYEYAYATFDNTNVLEHLTTE